MSSNREADSEWSAFMTRLESAEHEFAQGRPAAFKALWSHGDEVSLCGGFGGVESGWDNVGARLDWASSQISEGTRSVTPIPRWPHSRRNDTLTSHLRPSPSVRL